MWTGTNVPSEHWTAADATAYGEAIGRTPVVWENWTNNDTAGNVDARSARRGSSSAPTCARPRGPRGPRLLLQPRERGVPEPAAAGDAPPTGWRTRARYRPRASWLRAVASWRRAAAAGPSSAAARCGPGPRRAGRTSSTASARRRRSCGSQNCCSRRYTGAGWVRPHRALVRELRLVDAGARAAGGAAASPRSPSRQPSSSTPPRITAPPAALAAALLAAERPRLEVSGTERASADRPLLLTRRVRRRCANELDAAASDATLDTEFTYGWRHTVRVRDPAVPGAGNVMDAVHRTRAGRWTMPGTASARKAASS